MTFEWLLLQPCGVTLKEDSPTELFIHLHLSMPFSHDTFTFHQAATATRWICIIQKPRYERNGVFHCMRVPAVARDARPYRNAQDPFCLKQTPPHAKRTGVSCLPYNYSYEELPDSNQKRLGADLETVSCRRDLQLPLHTTDLCGKRGT